MLLLVLSFPKKKKKIRSLEWPPSMYKIIASKQSVKRGCSFPFTHKYYGEGNEIFPRVKKN